MSGKRAWLCVLIIVSIGLGKAHAQDPKETASGATLPEEILPPPSNPWPAPGGDLSAPPVAAPVTWGAGRTHGQPWWGGPEGACCGGPIGGHGPILLEAHLRSGVSIPSDGGLGDVVGTGWAVQGGARALYVGTGQYDAPWTLDLTLSNYNYDGNDPNRMFTLQNVPVTTPQGTVVLPQVNVSVRGLNQTILEGALGREWYLIGTTDCTAGGATWRFGFDVGGGWGSAKLDLYQIRQRTDVIGRFFAGVHSDLEFPWHHGVILGGVRAEYSYTWSDLLPGNGNLEAFNVLLTLGTRF